MHKRHHLFLCLIRLAQCTDTSQGFDLNSLSTSVTGDEDYVFVGNNLTLTCSLLEELQERFTADDISFSFFNSNENTGDIRCLPMSSIHVIDTVKAKLIVHNVTVYDAGQYTCYVGNRYCLENNITNLSVVGMAEATIEYPPHNVTNFQCIVYNWIDSMNCSWQHPVDYVDKSNIDVASSFTISTESPVTSYLCPDKSYGGCRFNSGRFTVVEGYTIEVNVTHIPTNARASRNFPVSTYTSVKPAPVKELTSKVVENEPGCIHLSWIHPKGQYGIVYRIKHLEEQTFKVLNDTVRSTLFKACEYDPYTHHKFSVEGYPTSPYSGFWSDSVYTDAWTSMTAPTVGPRTTNGSFTSTECVSDLRNVTVMWQEVEEWARNGIIDSYFIKLGDNTLKTVTANVHMADVALSCYSSSKLTIYAHNKGGHSLEPSILLIPPVTFSVHKVITSTFAVEISQSSTDGHDSLRALWDITEDTENMDFTVFWCLGQECEEGQINWRKVPGTKTECSFPVLTSDAWKYSFGISVMDSQKQMSSSIFWTKCLYKRNPSFVHPTDKMDVISGIQNLMVTWNQVQCSYQNQVKVTQMKVKWCEDSHCNDKIFSEDVPAVFSSYKISSLKADVNYKVTVQPLSETKAGKEYTPWVIAQPIAPAGSQNLIWLVVLVILVPIICVIVCVIRIFHLRGRKFKALANRPILNLDNVQRPLPSAPQLPASLATSVENLLNATAATTTGPSLTNQDHVVIIDRQGVTVLGGCSSGDNFTEDISNNSRSHLIKSSRQKHGKSCPLPSPCVFNGAIADNSTSDYVQQHLITCPSENSRENDQCQVIVTDQQTRWSHSGHPKSESDYALVCLPDSSLSAQLPPTASEVEKEAIGEYCDWQLQNLVGGEQGSGPAGPESVMSYIRVAGASNDNLANTEETSQDLYVSDSSTIQIDKRFVNPIVFHVGICPSREHLVDNAAILTRDEDQRPVESSISGNGEDIREVVPTAPSVLGQGFQDVEAGSSKNERTSSNQPSPDVDISFSPSCSGNSDRSNDQSDTGRSQCSPGYLPHSQF